MCITNNNIILDVNNYCPPIELCSLFIKPGPIHIEIGSGKGTFLLNQARARPDVNFLGIEWANKYFLYSADRMRRWQVSNVRILRTDARFFLANYLPDQSVDVFHIYFPDPWPKKRHHKRRFFQPAQVAHLVRCLVEGGELYTATDHAEYFEVIRSLLINWPDAPRQLQPIDFFSAAAAGPDEWIGSNFERKYLRQGRPIYTLALRKI